jgi:hypothetical protein
MTIEQFAEKHRLRITRDDCNDPVIVGSRGHLYFDGEDLCLMAIDTRLKYPAKWEACGGKLWLGDVSRDAQNRGIQDVKIVGVTKPGAAIAMVHCRIRRILSDEEKARLREQLARSVNPSGTPINQPPLPLESFDEGEEDPEAQ